jgi:oligopeptide/dipeptide ABC transporter ATP-binding protein
LLREVSFAIGAGEAVGLVGESGSGKSMTARAVARLLPANAEATGSIRLGDLDVLSLRGTELRRYRRNRIAMIFQDPRAHINPVRTIGDFMTEAMLDAGVGRRAARDRAVELLTDVQLESPARLLRRFPHELSGGMLQRVMIASALANEPSLILADEPTTALDVTTQADVMSILDRLRRERHLALLFITHDLELAAATCDRTLVMYAGAIVEEQRSSSLYEAPTHPYTQGLLESRPTIHQSSHRLAAIPGQPIAPYEVSTACAFAPRCAHATDRCTNEAPMVRAVGSARVACHYAGQMAADESRRSEGRSRR